MNTFIFVVSPNGVGKSTACKAIHQRLPRSAWLESEWCRMTNPFTFSDASVSLTIDNITHMLRVYLAADWLDYTIFPYGFHGPRQQIWDTVRSNLQDIPHRFAPITLTCSEEESIARMERDGRDPARIQRALAVRHLYDSLPYPMIDTTGLSVQQTVKRVLGMVAEERPSVKKAGESIEPRMR